MLRKPDRLMLIMAIADVYRTKAYMSWSRMQFLLNSLGFGPDESDLEAQIGTGTDEQVLDLAEAVGVPLPENVERNAPVAAITAASMEPLFIFGSHLSAHKAFVGEVGRELAKYGVELFVAHDTITHDEAWEDAIRTALDHADAGLVFVHDGLKKSEWCDQEIGWLQGRHVPVMALRFDGSPYGFFGRHQAQPVPPGTSAHDVAKMTIARIASRPELAGGFAASLVSAMASKDDFDATRSRWLHLRDLDCLDAKLCAKLLAATKANSQIYWASSVLDDDGRKLMTTLIIAFLRRQPGGSAIAPDIDAYEQYLAEREASGAGFYTTHDPPPDLCGGATEP